MTTIPDDIYRTVCFVSDVVFAGSYTPRPRCKRAIPVDSSHAGNPSDQALLQINYNCRGWVMSAVILRHRVSFGERR